MKKLILRGMYLALFTTTILLSCQQNEDVTDSLSSPLDQFDIENTTKAIRDLTGVPAYIGDRIGGPLDPWIYWLDARYSRTCSTGPGVCFINRDEDPWNWTHINSVPTSDEIDETNPDFDEGGVMIGFEGDQIRLIFTKDVEDKILYIDENFTFPESMFSNFVEEPITVLAGEYKLNFDKYKYGEVVLKTAAPQRAIYDCDVFLTNRVVNNQIVTPADVLNFKVKMEPYFYNQLAQHPNWYCGYLYVRFPSSQQIKAFPLKQLLPNNEAIFSNGTATQVAGGPFGTTPLNYQMVYEVPLRSSFGSQCTSNVLHYNSQTPAYLNVIFTNPLTSCYHR